VLLHAGGDPRGGLGAARRAGRRRLSRQCRALSDAERARRRASGRPFALRVRADGERIEFDDRICGHYGAVVDDFVVRRADGVPAYQLAVVVDDAAQGVGEVVRGDDLVESTPRQILLARLLALPVPRYAHVPLVFGVDGARLAKRIRPPALRDRDEPPAATLALLAHSLGLARDRERVPRPAELLAEFDPERLPREPGVL
jgi:glutamyl-tRNA synthetase